MFLAERLGEYLIKAGKITEGQLASTLERQVIMGGRLGTNLIEMGYVSEDELAHFLSQKFAIPRVQADDLERIEPSLIQLVPRNIAEKYSAVPIRREKNTLCMAFLDPLDLEAIDELGFITGCVIKPYVASEARIRHALERHYQIDRPLRYISVLEEDRKIYEGVEVEKPAGKEPRPEELEAALHRAKEAWVEAKDRNQAFSVFMRAMNIVLDRGILFLVEPGSISGWKAFPAYLEPEIAGHRFKLKDLPLFSNVVAAKSFHQGPPPHEPVYQGLFQLLGSQPPKQILLFPILISDNVVAFLYGDKQVSELPVYSLEFLRKSVDKLEMLLQILILRKKILEL